MKTSPNWNLTHIRTALIAAGVDTQEEIDAGSGHYNSFWRHLPQYVDAWPEEALAQAWTAGLTPSGTSAFYEKFIAALKEGPSVPSPLPTVDRVDMWLFLLYGTRYAFHRQTHAVGDMTDAVLRYLSYLSRDQIKQLRDEATREVDLAERSGRTVGAGVDHDTWKKYIAALVKVLGRCTQCETPGHDTCSMTEGCTCCAFTKDHR